MAPPPARSLIMSVAPRLKPGVNELSVSVLLASETSLRRWDKTPRLKSGVNDLFIVSYCHTIYYDFFNEDIINPAL
jgi:hypothetical protein